MRITSGFTASAAVVLAVAARRNKKRKSDGESRRFRLIRGRIAHTRYMKKLRRLYREGKRKYDVLTAKKYTTLAGTLVFFFVMSVMPLSFWLSLFLAKLPVDTNQILELPVFDSVKTVLSYVRTEAENATAGVSLVLLVTSLYSATNLFYQMRRSGELIYDYRRPKRGLRLRVGALALTLIVLATFAAFLLIFALFAFLAAHVLSKPLERVCDYLLLTGFSFALVMLLNAYVCPYKVRFRRFLLGSFVTVGAWAVAVVGFSMYIKIGNVSRLYGALSAVIVFLLWLYALMICFVVGVIVNSEKITKELRASRRRKK